MAEGNVRRFFPGGNTPNGFHSFFRYLFPRDANHIFVIKGGPGVGKSTFMQRIADSITESGLDLEEHHCSSDPDSLDGIYIPGLKIGLVDGTAPHVVDPVYPGAVEEIICLGDYWNGNGLKDHRSAIVSLTDEIKRLFQACYRHLAIAKLYNDHIESIFSASEALDIPGLNDLAAQLVEKTVLTVEPKGKVARQRHLFASAITPKGLYNFFPTLFDRLDNLWIIVGLPGTGKSTVMSKVAAAAIDRGLDVETFHCALAPEKVDHVIIPEISTAIVNGSEPHPFHREKANVIETSRYVKQERIGTYQNEIHTAQISLAHALEQALGFLKSAKDAHDDLEEYYVSNMDFALINQKRDETLERIWALAGAQRPGER